MNKINLHMQIVLVSLRCFFFLNKLFNYLGIAKHWVKIQWLFGPKKGSSSLGVQESKPCETLSVLLNWSATVALPPTFVTKSKMSLWLLGFSAPSLVTFTTILVNKIIPKFQTHYLIDLTLMPLQHNKQTSITHFLDLFFKWQKPVIIL